MDLRDPRFDHMYDKIVAAERSGESEQSDTTAPAKEDSFFRVTVFQVAACLVLLGAGFLLKTQGGTLYQSLRDGFADMIAAPQESNFSDRLDDIAAAMKNFFGTENDTEENSSQETASEEDAVSSLPEDAPPIEGPSLLQVSAGVSSKNEVQYYSAPSYASFSPVVASCRLVLPLEEYTVTSPYGYRENPVGEGVDFHAGVDLKAPEGTPIFAAMSGTVTKVSTTGNAGLHVEITHGEGFVTAYSHMSRILVREGMLLRRGERIGFVGQTGLTTGPHLHFALKVDGKYADPAWLLEF